MGNRLIITLVIFLFSTFHLLGQDKLLLQHKSKPSKKKYLDLGRRFDIVTNDTLYIFKEIVAFSDTTISITKSTKTDKDTTYYYSHPLSETKDTNYSVTIPLYRQDTVTILFSQIRKIKKDWFKSIRWLEPFGYMALGAGLAVVLLPVAAIDKGAEGVKEWAAFEGMLLAICAPPIFIGTRQNIYNLDKKWTLKTEK